MQIFRTPEEFRSWRKSLGSQSVGFVPTMGALHAGHTSLLQRARSENDICVLSIFVNPTQFNDKTDFETFFAKARLNANASEIKGLICGYRVEEIEDPLLQQVRYLDKLVDELAKGKKMEKILRSASGPTA